MAARAAGGPEARGTGAVALPPGARDADVDADADAAWDEPSDDQLSETDAKLPNPEPSLSDWNVPDSANPGMPSEPPPAWSPRDSAKKKPHAKLGSERRIKKAAREMNRRTACNDALNEIAREYFNMPPRKGAKDCDRAEVISTVLAYFREEHRTDPKRLASATAATPRLDLLELIASPSPAKEQSASRADAGAEDNAAPPQSPEVEAAVPRARSPCSPLSRADAGAEDNAAPPQSPEVEAALTATRNWLGSLMLPPPPVMAAMAMATMAATMAAPSVVRRPPEPLGREPGRDRAPSPVAPSVRDSAAARQLFF